MWRSTGCRTPVSSTGRPESHRTRITAKACPACVETPCAVSQITNVQSICAKFTDLLWTLFGRNRNADPVKLRHAAHQGVVQAPICHPRPRYLSSAAQDVAELRRGFHPVAQYRLPAHEYDGDSRCVGVVKPWQRLKSRDSAACGGQ